jgi:hypothetical protein
MQSWPIFAQTASFVLSGVFMSDPNETYTDAETERRREAALQRMFATPHKPHKTTKAAESKKVTRGTEQRVTKAG